MNEFNQHIRPLSAPDFDAVKTLAHATCGISLHEGKKAIVSSRLEKLVRRYGFVSYTDYIHFVSQRKHCPEFTEFIDTLTTNHSGFWREPEHFVFLQKHVFPVKRNRIRIWSSACATGEEPYNIAMCAQEFGIVNCSINASDISRNALTTAIKGEYDELKLSTLPLGWADRYFSRSTATRCSVAAGTRALVSFAPLNLLHSFQHVGQFDVIFCRNVMIYFEQRTRDELVARLAEQLNTGGYLFTGHSETLLRLPAALEYVQPATYRKV